MTTLLQNCSYGNGDNFLKSNYKHRVNKNPTLKFSRVSVLISSVYSPSQNRRAAAPALAGLSLPSK